MNGLTFAGIMSMLDALPPRIESWPYCVTKPQHAARLQAEFRPSQGDILGIQIIEKPNQVADAWMISDRRILNRYLSGELSELDLMALAGPVNCKPCHPL